jgi:hypothetical protein
MLRQTTARALKASTSAILDFLEKNPRVSCKTIAKELNMPLKKVNAVHYQYGFTGSAQAKKLFPHLCEIGEVIRRKWPPIGKAVEAKWQAKTSAPLFPTPVEPSFDDALDKAAQARASIGQMILRDVILNQDDETMKQMREEINYLRNVVSYLENQLKAKNGTPV